MEQFHSSVEESFRVYAAAVKEIRKDKKFYVGGGGEGRVG